MAAIRQPPARLSDARSGSRVRSKSPRKPIPVWDGPGNRVNGAETQTPQAPLGPNCAPTSRIACWWANGFDRLAFTEKGADKRETSRIRWGLRGMARQARHPFCPPLREGRPVSARRDRASRSTIEVRTVTDRAARRVGRRALCPSEGSPGAGWVLEWWHRVNA